MIFDPPLLPGRLVRRYKRFLADVELAGELGGRVETVHCANPGSMMGLAEPGSPVWLSRSPNPARKLPLTWELVEVAGTLGDAPGGTLVGINTGYANRLAEEALGLGLIPALAGYQAWRREVAYGAGSRIDFLLTGPDRPLCYVEVKSVTLARGEAAEFPDSVTARGTRHLKELVEMRRQGARSVMLFLAQRGDCRGFMVASDIDPAYAAGLAAASAAGVEILAYGCRVTPQGIELAGPLPLAPGMAQTGATLLQNRAPRP
jgi:sugar fermentation stimulation protein A